MPTVVSSILCARIISNIFLLAVVVPPMPSRRSSLPQHNDILLWKPSLLLHLTQRVLRRLSLNTAPVNRLPGLVATRRPIHIMEAVLKPSNYLLSHHMLRAMRAIRLQLQCS